MNEYKPLENMNGSYIKTFRLDLGPVVIRYDFYDERMMDLSIHAEGAERVIFAG